ncbi:YbaB/EbfC family nucleoid-associated protein [Actinosynnema sp. NPDC023794]
METTDEVARLFTEWRAGVTEQAQRFDAARRAIDEVSVTETAAGGAVVLTVASSGIPTDLRLGVDVGRMKPDQVATQIMACLRRAQARLADRVGTVVAETIGDAAGGQAIAEEYQSRFPSLSAVDGEPPSPLAENLAFGLSDLDGEPEPPTAAPVPDRQARPGPPATAAPTAPVRMAHRAPGGNDDEDWEAPLW